MTKAMGTMLENFKRVIGELLASAQATPGKCLKREVLNARISPEAAAARAAREQATEAWPVEEDPEVRLARRLCDEINEQLAPARAHLAALEPPIGVIETDNRALSMARQLVKDLVAAWAEAAAWVGEAQRETRAWVYSKRPGLLDLDRQLLAAVQHTHALALRRQRYAEETTRLAGARDPDDPEHPFPMLLGWGEAIEKITARLDGKPSQVPAPPPRRGQIRLRAKAIIRDGLVLRLPGDPFDLDERDADDLVRRHLAEKVEA